MPRNPQTKTKSKYGSYRNATRATRRRINRIRNESRLCRSRMDLDDYSDTLEQSDNADSMEQTIDLNTNELSSTATMNASKQDANMEDSVQNINAEDSNLNDAPDALRDTRDSGSSNKTAETDEDKDNSQQNAPAEDVNDSASAESVPKPTRKELHETLNALSFWLVPIVHYHHSSFVSLWTKTDLFLGFLPTNLPVEKCSINILYKLC